MSAHPTTTSAENDEELIFSVAGLFSDSQKLHTYLDLACNGDSALRNRVETLLNAAQHAEAFFGRPDNLPRVTIPSDAEILDSLNGASAPLGGRYTLRACLKSPEAKEKRARIEEIL